MRVRCSCMVGEGFFGAEPRKSFLVENLRDKLLPPDLSWAAGGDVMLCSCGIVGSGCWLSLSMRKSGSISSRNRLFSSMTLLRSSLRWRSSDSAVCMRSSRIWTTRMTLAKSSWVGGASCADVSAAEVGVGKRLEQGREGLLTQGHVVVWFYWDILLDLDLVDGFEDGQTVSNTANAHLLELRMLKCSQHIARDDLLCARMLVLCMPVVSCRVSYQQMCRHTARDPGLI